MKICKHCKHQNFDMKESCDKCGFPLNNEKLSIPQQNGLVITTRVFLMVNTIISAVAAASFLTAWLIMIIIIPSQLTIIQYILMAISVIAFVLNLYFWKGYNDKVYTRKKVSTAFKICTLIFANIIPGILMLCTDETSFY